VRTRPLFIPLRTEFFEAFKRGEKTAEFRLYGPRWNERVCWPGRRAVLSKGYGKGERLEAVVRRLHTRQLHDFNDADRATLERVFPNLRRDNWVAVIFLELQRPAA
jgi:hypothetical protein